jgi:outer membrane protein
MIRLLGTILILSMLSANLFAQTDVKTLSLDQAIDIAVKKNLQLNSARRNARAATWGVRNAYCDYLPQASVGMTYVRLDEDTYNRANIFYNILQSPNSPFPIPQEYKKEIRPSAWQNSYAPSFSVVQPVFTGGALLANLKVAKAQEHSAEANVTDSEQEVIFNTQKAFYDVLRAQELVIVARDFVKAADEHLISARKKVELGIRNQAEISRWELQKATAESYLIRAENGLAIARPALNHVLGAKLDEQYQLLPAEEIDIQFPATLQEREQQAQNLHPAIKIMDANLQMANAGVMVARSGFLPTLSLAYNYSWEANDTPELDSYKTWSLAVVMQYPIFNGFRDVTSYQKSRQARMQVMDLTEDVKRNINLGVRQASFNLDAMFKQLEIAEKAKAFADETLRIVRSTYDNGLASNLDFLDAQNACNQAHWDYVNSKYDYYLAMTGLARAMGTLKK